MTEDELRKQAKLTEAEIEAITAKALVDNPHWEVDAWGLFAVVAQAQWDKAFSPIQQYTWLELEKLGFIRNHHGHKKGEVKLVACARCTYEALKVKADQ